MITVKAILKDYTKTFKKGYILTFETSQANISDEQFNSLKMAKNGLKINISEYKEKRSLNANNYSWKLQDEIAKKINSSIDDVHIDMIMSYGVIETYSILKDVFNSAVRVFDYYKILGESEINGKMFLHIRAGIGTHLYNTKEMSRFIDGVIYEAEQLGIQTETPEKIAEMKSLWSEYDK